MPLTDPVDILLEQNDWALRTLIDACANLDDSDFHREFPIGCGSLHNTVVHILAAMRGWADVLAGRPARPRIDERDDRLTTEQLHALRADATAELVALADAHPSDEWLSVERIGRTWTFARGGILAHVVTHGMHHRAQCLNILRQLNQDPLPPSSVLEWMATENGAPTS